MSTDELEYKYSLLVGKKYSTVMYEGHVRCAVCQRLDWNSNVVGISSAILIVEGIHYIDEETFHYVPPQHKECTIEYEVNKVAPEI